MQFKAGSTIKNAYRSIRNAASSKGASVLTDSTITANTRNSRYGLTADQTDVNGATTLYGKTRIPNNNPFAKFNELAFLNPHVALPLVKLGLQLTLGFQLVSKNDTALAAMNTWADEIELFSKAQNIAFNYVKEGTVAVYLYKHTNRMDTNKPFGWIQELEILPMRHTTLLPEIKSEGKGLIKPKTNLLLKGTVKNVVLNEKIAGVTHTTGVTEKSLDRKDVALFRFFHAGHYFFDILGRETYGIYGIPLMQSIDRPLKNYLDLIDGHAAYMKRYGIGRLHIDVEIYRDLIMASRFKEAEEVLTAAVARQRNIKAEEDIVAGGVKVNNVGASSVPTVKDMKESYEKDINIGLLQSPLTMGKTSGSTYASGYLSEQDRLMVLESLQAEFRHTFQTEILDAQLKAMGYNAGEVELQLTKLNTPVIDYATLLDAEAQGTIENSETRGRMGFPLDKPSKTKRTNRVQ